MSAIAKLRRKISGKGVAAIAFTLFIWNENMDDIIKIVESLEKSGLLIDGSTETKKLK